MNIFKYIADKNLKPAIELLKKVGYPKPTAHSDAELKYKVAAWLADYFKRNKDNPETIKNIVSVHPDLPIISKYIAPASTNVQQPKVQETQRADGEYSNCNACALVGADSTTGTTVTSLSAQTINYIIIGSAVVLIAGIAATIYFANRKKS